MPPPGGTQTRGTRPERDNAPEGGTQGEAGRHRNERSDLAKWQKTKGILKEIIYGSRGKVAVAVNDIAFYGG